MSVYNIADESLVVRVALPGVAEIRGIGASAATGMLYVSYGGLPTGIGHLLEFSLYRQRSCMTAAIGSGSIRSTSVTMAG